MLIHPLPSQYLLASGSHHTEVHGNHTLELLRLTAWMPDRHGTCLFESSEIDIDDWIHDHCSGCDFYFETYEEYDSSVIPIIRDADNNRAVSITYESRCPCKSEGFSAVEFPCPAGYSEPLEDDNSEYNGPLPPMAYAIDCVPATGNVFETSAWMQAVNPNSHTVSSLFRAINTFDTHRVCWGPENTQPDSLPQAVATYSDATCNEDLLDAMSYAYNCKRVRADRAEEVPSGSLIGAGYDAALLVSIKQHLSAYLMLRGAGFPASNGVIAVGLRHHIQQLDDTGGAQIRGYISQPDSLGRCWFCANAPIDEHDPKPFLGLLLGQIPNPDSACTSTAPSSSEPVALAAS